MSDDVTGRKYSQEDQQLLRQRLLEHRNTKDLRWKDIAAESGVPMGTLSPWAGGTYQGEGSPIAEKVERYLASTEKREAVRAIAPDMGFVMTPSAQDFMALLNRAQHMPDMSVLTGAPGVGKTKAACEYKRRNPNVFKIVAEPSLSTIPALLGSIAHELRVTEVGRQDRIARLIKQRLIGTRALIIVDEAQHLTTEMLDQLRAFHDQAEIGIALVGNSAVIGRLEGGRRSQEYAQLYSRVGMRLNRREPKKGDVEAMLDAWGVEEKDVRLALRAVAKQGGALRSCNKAFLLAQMIAANEGRTLSTEDVQLAYGQISDQRVPLRDAA
ncbi:MAG: AAA family ATPase [Roseococcus sp.]|nr:AAA family ATPase [Roseococcus sp.]